ncbi:FAD-linked sulfhydryl oxidase ERV1 [Carex littledalei]|uniref:Sulfhydryl oxidase n=1 Tax=Carex littledalei TaxID=544730 RepID=A0A833VXZ2_9POAL|nr:FAD-linked sulfhydryl oxidase ERV1 [Carex littledalei]
MSENPLKPVINTVASISRSLQTHLSRFLIAPDCTADDLTINSLTTNPLCPFLSFSLGAETTVAAPPIKEKEVKPLTKEELGRATWTLLHTIAAQYPDQPTRQQRRDAKELKS